ncbi:MAG: hypothetical protein DSM106950_19910 [Stigonema ocellatum SAG 48.90 = DSM 106950]|nr:hypothetical protein [Stigonema ocellatum SAG 48.90 = DSM 106950]
MSKSFSRRQILKIAVTLVMGLTTTLLAPFLMTKEGSKAQAIVVNQPNEFDLKGEHTEIKYTVISGVPQLDYKNQDISSSFSGQEIQTLTTDIGTLITVTISTPNSSQLVGNTVKLSLLLPIVNLLVTGGEVPIQTNAIVTTQKTTRSFGIPLFGQIQNYQTLVLNGTARLVLE